MPALQGIPGVTVHGKGRGEFVLPLGYVDSTGGVHNRITLREMSGVEDDIMGDDDIPFGERATEVLSLCCTKLGEITDADTIKDAIGDTLKAGLPLTEQDRKAALIFLRRTSVGDAYRFNRTCPRCGTPAKGRRTNLSTLKIAPVEDPTKRCVKVTLPRSGKTATMSMLTAGRASQIAALRPKGNEVKTMAILGRVDTLDGDQLPNSRDGFALIQALPQADRNHLRHVWNAMEANVEDEIEVDCKAPLCGTSWSFQLDVGQYFFLDLDTEVDPKTLTWS